ncbi:MULTISPECIES: CPBP family intramembrane glutamic endopeptidase [Arenibacter]|uniref:CPBP family intramembrane glutamic endopeptidase n=1 Tax=Arenibacter TaxID=178469 RepID=UPI001124C8D7|nr:MULTISPECIES: CPBP family intramembrane glutamic endopeptidase [Arenibacter]
MVTLKKLSQSTFLDVLVFIFLIAISYFKPIPFPWKVPTIAAIILAYMAMRYHDLGLLGLDWPRWKNTVIWGFIIAITIVVCISNLVNPMMERLLNTEVDVSAYGDLKGNAAFVTDYWWKAMLSAAIAEEIFYRGFTFYVLEKLFKNLQYHKVLVVLVTAFYFGVSHSFQGIVGVTGIFLAAIVFGSSFYLSKKNLYAIILGHALVDSWSLYSLYKGGISLFF